MTFQAKEKPRLKEHGALLRRGGCPLQLLGFFDESQHGRTPAVTLTEGDLQAVIHGEDLLFVEIAPAGHDTGSSPGKQFSNQGFHRPPLLLAHVRNSSRYPSQMELFGDSSPDLWHRLTELPLLGVVGETGGEKDHFSATDSVQAGRESGYLSVRHEQRWNHCPLPQKPHL